MLILIELFVYNNVSPFKQNGWTPLMRASFGGHADIVQTLIEAKAQINTQEEVYTISTTRNTLTHCTHTTSSHTVSLYTAVLGEVTVCLCPHRMAGLLFTWQLRKAKLMW